MRGITSVAAALRTTTTADAIANPTQPGAGGSIANAVTSPATRRRAAIVAKMSAKFTFALTSWGRAAFRSCDHDLVRGPHSRACGRPRSVLIPAGPTHSQPFRPRPADRCNYATRDQRASRQNATAINVVSVRRRDQRQSERLTDFEHALNVASPRAHVPRATTPFRASVDLLRFHAVGALERSRRRLGGNQKLGLDQSAADCVAR